MQPAARTTATEPAPRAPAAWVAAAAPRVRRYLRCLRCPRDLVDDVVQDALLAAVGAHGGQQPPLPWLFTVAKNRWLELCRRKRPELVAALDALDLRTRAELGDDGGDSRVQALRHCVERLPARSRQALELCYGGEQLARPDVAARLGLGIEGLRSLLARLRTALKQCIERRRERDA
jgi:RNA polymerase sigma-70 factor (ECF subfamily)